MCAIIGQVGGKINKNIFIKARDSMINRGPDDAGFYYDKEANVALGHRRLSILDLSSAGHQPMFSSDDRYAIVFNGEIFNFIELKRELSNYDFKTKTDTEVLLAAYIKWGSRCLNRLNGQFAFAIYDKHTKELFCARDHLGIKPFYYRINKGVLLFASEIKAILKLGVSAKANNKVIFDYLKYGFYDHSEDTFFEDVKRLMPGQYGIWKNGKFVITTYWDLSLLANREGLSDGLSENKTKTEFKNLVSDAIKLQFRSDVPVGLNLSGGLDSACLLFFSELVTGGKLNLFTGGVEDDKYDEVKVLESILTKKQRQRWQTSNLRQEKVWPLAAKLLDVEDEPYGGLSTISYFNLYEQTGMPGVKVLLEGQGMDEILAGYKYYTEKDGRNGLSQDATSEILDNVLNPDFCRLYRKKDFPKPFKSELLNKQYRDIRYTKIPRVLRFNDHISLAYSKELRVPYLDYRLVEFCFFLPEKFKIQKGEYKTLLRNTMADVLPGSIKNKPKFFFGAFQTVWLRKYFKKEVYAILNSKTFRSRPFWVHNKILEYTDNFYSGKGDNSFFLWQWLNLELWFRKFID